VAVLEMEGGQCRAEWEESEGRVRRELNAAREDNKRMQRDMHQHGIDLLSNATQIRTLQEQLDRFNPITASYKLTWWLEIFLDFGKF